MRVAIVGSRKLNFPIPESCIPKNTTQIISGGARGIDTSARRYAQKHNIQILEFLPNYDLYGRSAPIIRNNIIVENAELVIAFWDGKSKGTQYVINRCRKTNTPIRVYTV